MKITVITGSPRKNGTSNYLANEFIRGAKEAGHELFKFDSIKTEVRSCIACGVCKMGANPCVQKDDFADLKELVTHSEVIVFVTPIYYFGMTSDLKRIIDRFYSIDSTLRELQNRAILITTQHSPLSSVSKGINKQYKAILEWLNIENEGIINALGIESVEQLKETKYPKKAYELGKSLVQKY